MRIAQRLITSAAIAVTISCSGSTKKVDSTGGQTIKEPTEGPRYIKKVALTWTFEKKSNAKNSVYLVLTDQNGQARSYPQGDYEGECVSVGPRAADRAIVAASCKLGGVGIELHVIPNGAELTILKIPVVDGTEIDVMAGTRLQSVPIPLDAKIEAG
jgi:hypothetical protein